MFGHIASQCVLNGIITILIFFIFLLNFGN